MSDPKKNQSGAGKSGGDTSFDDLEDAFFATGDAESFWDKTEAETGPEVIDDNGAPTPAIVSPNEFAETGDTVDSQPQEASMVSDQQVDIAEPVAPPEPTGEFYNPSALHPSPDLLMDEETEVLSGDEADAFLEEMGSTENPETVSSEARVPDGPSSEKSADPFEGLDETEPTNIYQPLATDENAWIEAAKSLQREAKETEGETQARHLIEAGRILLSRGGLWERAGACFEGALASGLPSIEIPKGYADVVASQGRFGDLRDLLVARAERLSGAAAVEALQDAAIVERNHLQDDKAAVVLLESALTYGDDWFTLRLLREMHYRTQDWERLTDVLGRMADLGSGARSARCKVEEGRIREAELDDLAGAAAAYRKALEFDDTFMDAFLARQRVALLQKDQEGLGDMYSSQAERTSDANACFWWLRAARAQQNSDPDQAETSYQKAIDAAGESNSSVCREAQVWLLKAGRMDGLFAAMKAEADLDPNAQTSAVLLMAQVFGGMAKFNDRVTAHLTRQAEIDPSCEPLTDRLVAQLNAAGEFEQAISALSRHLETIEGSRQQAAVIFRQAEIVELNLGSPERAAELFERANAVDSTHPFAGRAAARNWVQSQKPENAVSVLQSLADSAADADTVSRIWHQVSEIHRHETGDVEAANTAAQLSFEASILQPAALDGWISSLEKQGDTQALADGLAKACQGLSSPNAKIEAAYRAARLYTDCCNAPQKARPLLQRCVELDPHCDPAVSLLRRVCELTGDWATVYDLRRIQAGNSTGTARLWLLTEAGLATHHHSDLDAQTVALEILTEDKTNGGALASLERAALEQGDAHRLVGVYRRVRSVSDDLGARTAYSVRLADIASSARDKQLAIRSVTRVLEASVGPRPYGAMARLAVGLEAWALAEAALHADGDIVGLARLLEATSDDQKRISATWRSITKKAPKNLEAHGGLERALSRLGSRDGLADTHAALADHEQDPTISTMHALLAGHLYENEETPQKALDYYSKAFQQSPFRGKAFEALVRIHGEAGDADAIQELFDKIEVGDPIALADAMHDASDHSRAERIYKQAVGSLGKSPAAEDLAILVRYERALERSENWQEVFKLLELRRKTTTSEQERLRIEAKRRWVLSERMADSDEAWNFYRTLHEEQPEDREVLENLARIAGARGEKELAVQFLDGLSNIAETADDAARYQRRIAEVHVTNEAPGEARSAYFRALDHLPGDLDAMRGIQTLARASEDWKGLVGILCREADIASGDKQLEIAREIAEIWEGKLDDSAVAAEHWRRVIELAPGDQVALQHLVTLAEQNGEWRSFIDDGKSLVNFLDGEERSSLLARMGRAALQNLRREDEAVRFLDSASSSDHPNLQAAEDLEKIYAARGSWDLVVDCTLRRARASSGANAVELFLQAARSKRDQLRDRKGAASIYDEALSIDENQPEALQFKSNFLFDNGNLAQAVDLFEALEGIEVERDLDDFDVQMEQALYYFRFGDAQRQLGKTDEAIRRYEQALALNASHLPTLEAVGPLYVSSNNWDSASRTFRQVLQLTGGQGDPARLARVYACLGTVEQAQGNIAKATQRFKKALELQPNDVEALRGYACVLFSQKDWNNLLNAYNNIIYHAKEKSAFIDAYLMKGFVLDVHMTLSDKAAQHYEKSLSFDPSHPVALLRLAELALRKEEWDRALSYASRALSVGGDTSDKTRGCLMVVQAVAYVQTSRPEEAQAALEGAQTVSKEVREFVGSNSPEAAEMHEALRNELNQSL